MKKLAEDIVQFFRRQSFVVVTTIDSKGRPHSSCKGIVAISQNGRIFLLDLYHARTYENLQGNPNVSITAVDEHKFEGYCLKGKARAIGKGKFSPGLLKSWEDRITSRITQRMLRNIREEAGSTHHAEALLPDPKYLIIMEVEEAVNLKPPHLKEKA